MITVSDKAKEYIVQLRQEQKESENAFIRVGVKGGGCSGLEYQLKFDSEIKQVTAWKIINPWYHLEKDVIETSSYRFTNFNLRKFE